MELILAACVAFVVGVAAASVVLRTGTKLVLDGWEDLAHGWRDLARERMVQTKEDEQDRRRHEEAMYRPAPAPAPEPTPPAIPSDVYPFNVSGGPQPDHIR